MTTLDGLWVVTGFSLAVATAVFGVVSWVLGHMLTERSRRAVAVVPILLGSLGVGVAFFLIFVTFHAQNDVGPNVDGLPEHVSAACGSVVSARAVPDDLRHGTVGVMVVDALAQGCSRTRTTYTTAAQITGIVTLAAFAVTLYQARRGLTADRTADQVERDAAGA